MDNSLIQEIEVLGKKLLQELDEIKDLDSLKDFKVTALGHKGALTSYLKGLKDCAPEIRPQVGKTVNLIKANLQKGISDFESKLLKQEQNKSLEQNKIDPTLPGKHFNAGSKHPIYTTQKEIVDAFNSLGYVITEGPDIEHESYNFDALNIAKSHPARDMQDTFYISEDLVLRTHTSPVQIRTMLQTEAPIKILSPGRVYRSDYDTSHSPMFHQVEGLYIGKGASLASLKGTLLYFVQKIFGKDTKIRLRPSYFPFTEPSAEVDVSCVICKGKGCKTCQQTGWVEILGCGMVHPNVLENVGYPKGTRGFAFGLGIERIAMIKYGIDDIRRFYENDLRFISQFTR